ncbi:protein FAM83F [Engraulis encrasicolus]|uniref:protein FAM83F n=1 Tax=Engraulis encrasicolus TaxID=184585 RepID=UPI002FD5986D
MAESQLECMEDGQIKAAIPESRPEFVYSEEERVALELLLKEGDGAFKMLLKTDDKKDFLSAREVKWLRETVKEYPLNEEDDSIPPETENKERRGSDSPSLRSTYWPQLSDTEVPALDIGWPSGGFFKGVTRVQMFAHPPKPNEPHIKEVVRKLIQGAHKVIAIVMDLLTDLHILQDLLDAASRRGVAVYVVLDLRGAVHFLDMCNRLQVGPQHLKNLRVRTVRGIGFPLSFGSLPGTLSTKYMLVDGDKAMFGTYSFSWSSFRMDRNLITVLSGQAVDFFDNDFRELYAVSEKLDLYKEFHISRPKPLVRTATVEPKRPPLAAVSTSRFQVTLGDSKGPLQGGELNLKVPEHKYYNPKYQLAFGGTSHLTPPITTTGGGSLQDLRTPLQPTSGGGGAGAANTTSLWVQNQQATRASSERLDSLGPLPGAAAKAGRGATKNRTTFKWFRSKQSSQEKGAKDEGATPSSSPTSKAPNGTLAQDGSFEDLSEMAMAAKGKNKRLSKLGGAKSPSLNTVHTIDESGTKVKKKRQSQKCSPS